MAIVENVDKMAANLQPLLRAERPKVTIESKNVGESELAGGRRDAVCVCPFSGQSEVSGGRLGNPGL